MAILASRRTATLTLDDRTITDDFTLFWCRTAKQVVRGFHWLPVLRLMTG